MPRASHHQASCQQWGYVIRAAISMCCLSMLSVAHATSHEGTAKHLEGTWCSQDAHSGETIVQYFVSESNVTALTVLSEADPRRVGSSTSLEFEEARSLASGAYQKCDFRQAWARAQAFLASPAAEAATRRVMAAEIARKFELELLEREDAELQQRRDAERDAYFAELIQQLSLVRRSRS